MKTPRTIHYSQLRYEQTSYKKDGKVRCWFIEDQYKHFWHDIYKDLRLLFWRVLKWLKIEYRKEFLFGFVLLFALVPSPKPVRAQAIPISVPAYLKPIPKLSPYVPVVFSVPDEVQPIVPPPPAPVVAPPAAPAYVAPVNNAPSGCGDNFYANYIYMHESGCRTDAIGPNGPCGLGQALPCSKMGCSLSDYACQNAWFTNYAMQRYGSWGAAYSYWVANHNW